MVKNQKSIDYYENGNKKSEGKIKIVRFKSRGSYEGPSKSDLDDWDIDQRHSFYEGGGRDNDRYHSTIENNLTFMNDLWKYYYENGNIKCEGKFKDGILKSKYKDFTLQEVLCMDIPKHELMSFDNQTKLISRMTSCWNFFVDEYPEYVSENVFKSSKDD